MAQVVRSFAPKVDQEKKIIFDYRYCKGCGVCANECPTNAIAMVKEGSQ